MPVKRTGYEKTKYDAKVERLPADNASQNSSLSTGPKRNYRAEVIPATPDGFQGTQLNGPRSAGKEMEYQQNTPERDKVRAKPVARLNNGAPVANHVKTKMPWG